MVAGSRRAQPPTADSSPASVFSLDALARASLRILHISVQLRTYRDRVEPRNPEREARQAKARREALAKMAAEDAANDVKARKRAQDEMAERERLREERASAGAASETGAEPDIPQVPAGWYRDPSMANTRRYWDGVRWTDNVAPADSSPPGATEQPQWVSALILAGAVIGLIMSLQSTTVLQGSGTIWTGFAIAGGASVAANWILKNGLPPWVRAVAVICAVLAFINAIAVENELDERRQEINDILQP